MKRRTAFELLSKLTLSVLLVDDVQAQSDEKAAVDLLALDGGALRYTVSSAIKSVEDVIADVEFSVAEYNYRLTSRNNVGHTIADRGESSDKRVARVFHFCNIQIAEQLLAAGDEYLLHMPCRLVVWEAQGSVWVASRLLPTTGRADPVLVLKINNMMRAIADFSIET